MKIFESVSSRSSFHSDSVGSLPVGGEFSLFGVLHVSPENEIAYFEFPSYDLFAVASGYFLFSRCFSQGSFIPDFVNKFELFTSIPCVGWEVGVGVSSPCEFG